MRTAHFFYLLWIAVSSTAVYGNYLLTVDINSIANPTNRVSDNSCCTCCEVEDTCNDPCDVGLRLCVRPAGFDHSDFSCPLLLLHVADSPRRSQWAFNGRWPGSVQLYIRVTHTVGERDEDENLTDDLLIDNIYVEISNITSFSPLTPERTFPGVDNRAEAELQFEVNCDNNRYGPFCDVECHGRDDAEGHYQCDVNGDRECIEGYQSLENNCTECVTADECTPVSTSEIGTQAVSTTHSTTPSITVTVDHTTQSPPEATVTMTPSSTVNPATSSTSELTILLPTVGGVNPAETETQKFKITLPMIVAAVGGLLLLLMIIIVVVTLVAVQCARGRRGVLHVARRRKRGLLSRVYEISTSGPDRNGATIQNDENRLLDSTTPTSSQNDVTFSTFRNSRNEQQLHRELHVYYHHNTPPPSAGAAELERGAESAEMEFPSGYTDPWPDEAMESHLQWSLSARSDGSEYLSKGGSDGELNHMARGRHSFNEYQLN